MILLKLYKRIKLFYIQLLFIIVIGCNTDKRIYPAVGVIHEVISEKSEMVIHHDEIPDFMMAMTMTLKVHKSVNIDNYTRGDSISFDIVIEGNNGYIKSLYHLGKAKINEPEDDFWEDENDAIKVGEIMPNATFLNLDSLEVSLEDNKG